MGQTFRPYNFFFSSRRRHTRSLRDWSSDVCSSDLSAAERARNTHAESHVRQQIERGSATQAERRDRLELVDRKSTRLNSSHVESSYAVFCLKKKTAKRYERLVATRFWCAPAGADRR